MKPKADPTNLVAKLRQLAEAMEANPHNFSGSLDIDMRIDSFAKPARHENLLLVRDMQRSVVGEVWKMEIFTKEKLS